MSKPKPGLAKGVVRTASLHPPVPLAPIVHAPTRRTSPKPDDVDDTRIPHLSPIWDYGDSRSKFTILGLPRHYSTASHVNRNALASTSYSYYTPSIPPSLLSKDLVSHPDIFHYLVSRPTYTNDKPPVEPSPSEVHALLSPNPTTSSTHISLTSNPVLLGWERPSQLSESPEASQASTSLHSSSLIFHLGASGHAKHRYPIPPSRSSQSVPPRKRSFTLPPPEHPTSSQLHSTSVGEDAYFTRSDGMCIADGVGGWARNSKGDAGRWSRLLTHFCERETEAWWNTKQKHHQKPLDPIEIMQKGYEKCLACILDEGLYGSSTCLLALLYKTRLLVANLGDCSLLLIRDGDVVFQTKEMQHAFNFPLQAGTHSRDEPMKDAEKSEVDVEKGDIVVLGSDGLMDNLYVSDILEEISYFGPTRPPNPMTPPPSPPAKVLPPFDPQKVSEALCKRARTVSEEMSASTPFMERAIEEGIDFVGGKRDDITVLVGVIGERDPTKRLSELTIHN